MWRRFLILAIATESVVNPSDATLSIHLSARGLRIPRQDVPPSISQVRRLTQHHCVLDSVSLRAASWNAGEPLSATAVDGLVAVGRSDSLRRSSNLAGRSSASESLRSSPRWRFFGGGEARVSEGPRSRKPTPVGLERVIGSHRTQPLKKRQVSTVFPAFYLPTGQL